MNKLKKIDNDEVRIGMEVYFKYSRSESEPVGPLKVVGRTGSHQGECIALHDRLIYLADDDDFGEPTFYTKA